jgi:hypothetical protein
MVVVQGPNPTEVSSIHHRRSKQCIPLVSLPTQPYLSLPINLLKAMLHMDQLMIVVFQKMSNLKPHRYRSICRNPLSLVRLLFHNNRSRGPTADPLFTPLFPCVSSRSLAHSLCHLSPSSLALSLLAFRFPLVALSLCHSLARFAANSYCPEQYIYWPFSIPF